MDELSELSLWCKWKRPASVPYPNTWRKFTTKSKDGKVYKIKIVDLTPDRYAESKEFMKNYYFAQEPLNISLQLLEDEISFQSNQRIHSTVLQQQICIVAVSDENVPNPEIVGLVTLLVASKEDNLPNMPGDKLQLKYKLIKDLTQNHNPFEMFSTDKIIRVYGLCVNPKHSGLNIGYNILHTVQKLSKVFHITASEIVCSNIRSQVIADKVGYKLYNEIVYDEYKDDQDRVIFPVKGTKSIKYMAIEYV